MLKVELSRQAERDLERLPEEITLKARAWISYIKKFGLQEGRKISGYHYEILQGKRFGQRSIRLNRAYRLIYTLNRNGQLQIVTILEVNKHGY